MLTRSGNRRAAATAPAATNGSLKPEDVDSADETALSPPPSSMASSVSPDVLGDEIIVGTNTHAPVHNGQKSPSRFTSEPEDVEMAQDDEPNNTHYPKRKRSSIYNDLSEDKLEGSLPSGADDGDERPVSRATSVRRHGLGSNMSVLLGYWRDSPVPKAAGKHAVVGFMDVRDRLRTRIHNGTRNGDAINTRLFPVPPGPGGSWVTFERVVFQDHLIGLDHNQIKEYVKIRTAEDAQIEDEETKRKNDLAAVKEAIRRVERNPPPETAQAPAIAYGLDIPEDAHTNARPDSKRRRTGSAVGTISGGEPIISRMQPQAQPISQPQPQPQHDPAQTSQPSPMINHHMAPIRQQPQHATIQQQHQPIPDNLPGTRPTRIMVGCWSKSSATEDSEKHAVYGILGANDMFRVKLVRETMDGRFINGNFPTGAGALWIPYEDVTMLPHLQNLTRSEMKEYCRIRQYQIDLGEHSDERVANETKAVYEAQRRAAMNPKIPPTPSGRPNLVEEQPRSPKSEQPMHHDLRHRGREMIPNDMRAPRGMAEAEMRQNGRNHSADAMERTNNLARREISKMEHAQMRQYGPGGPGRQMQNVPGGMSGSGGHHHDNRTIFSDNMGRLNKVWQSQEAQRMQPPPPQQVAPPPMQMQQPMSAPAQGPNDDSSKVYNGMKYERKQTGPFAGKLASNGTIISIDGEDYVEYRVLTKVQFF
ncbi:hypothetical protein PG999_002705 [Apiospora kogelbergensis]|uniref:Uncharacterized protein n=1 Tax=Apiospora kogelbergensis TaxID=1337665 RepID=A0AAW0R981_9PEZI